MFFSFSRVFGVPPRPAQKIMNTLSRKLSPRRVPSLSRENLLFKKRSRGAGESNNRKQTSHDVDVVGQEGQHHPRHRASSLPPPATMTTSVTTSAITYFLPIIWVLLLNTKSNGPAHAASCWKSPCPLGSGALVTLYHLRIPWVVVNVFIGRITCTGFQ